MIYEWSTDDEDMYGRLIKVKTDYPNYNGTEIIQTHDLTYGPYLNQYDETESVLQKIQQITKFGDNAQKSEMIETCKEKNDGGTPV